jgi:hypothetical protein
MFFYLHLLIRSSIWPLWAPYDKVEYCKTYLADSVLPKTNKEDNKFQLIIYKPAPDSPEIIIDWLCLVVRISRYALSP